MSAWPDPSANALDRARAIARTYRDALAKARPQTAIVLDEAAQRVGEGWVCGASSGQRACTVREAALILGVTAGRVRQLIAADELRSEGKDRDGHVLLVADVHAYQRSQRVARSNGANALASPTSG